jgi:hypothetical protein
MPSYSSFADLDQEFSARSKNREVVRQGNTASEGTSGSGTKPEREATKLDEESVKNQIDPFAPDLDGGEGRKEPFRRTARDKDADWSEGVDSFDDLPPGEELLEGDDGSRSKVDRLRRFGYKNADGVLDKTQQGINKANELFDRPPTGSHSVVKTDQPVVVAPHHGINVGEATTAVLAAGLAMAELTRRAHDRIKARGEK